MKSIRVIVTIAVLAVALACARRTGTLSSNLSMNVNADAVEPATPTIETIPKDTVITMERTVCYGTCPHYKLTVYANGRVVFEGRDFVKKKGRVESRISPQQVEQLLTEFERANFFALRNAYETEADGCETVWTDHPTTTTTIKTNGKTKSVAHYHGCQGAKIPQSLTELENRIDAIVNSAQWIR